MSLDKSKEFDMNSEVDEFEEHFDVDEAKEITKTQEKEKKTETKYSVGAGEVALVRGMAIKGFLQGDEPSIWRLAGIANGIQKKRNLNLDETVLNEYKELQVKEDCLRDFLKEARRNRDQILTNQWRDLYKEITGEELIDGYGSISHFLPYISNQSTKLTAQREMKTIKVVEFIAESLTGTDIFQGLEKTINQYLYGKRKDLEVSR